jgi:RimJ/RimL family protein N-acetyltransferase
VNIENSAELKRGEVLMTAISLKNWVERKIPSLIKMKGQYCYLETLDIPQHAPPLFSVFQNTPEIWKYLPWGPFETYDCFEAWLRQDSLLRRYFTIIDAYNEQVQGLASYMDIDTTHGVIEIGAIHYSKLLQNTRAGTEAMYLMMQRVFEELQYRRLQWRCNSFNIKSRNAALRLGFKFEGIFRQTNVFKGHNRDTAWYSIIDSEWPQLKEKFEKWLLPSNFDAHGKQFTKLLEI